MIKDTIFMRIGDLFTGAFPMFKIYNVPIGSSILIDDRCIALAVMEKDDEYLSCYDISPFCFEDR